MVVYFGGPRAKSGATSRPTRLVSSMLVRTHGGYEEKQEIFVTSSMGRRRTDVRKALRIKCAAIRNSSRRTKHTWPIPRDRPGVRKERCCKWQLRDVARRPRGGPCSQYELTRAPRRPGHSVPSPRPAAPRQLVGSVGIRRRERWIRARRCRWSLRGSPGRGPGEVGKPLSVR